MFVWCFKLAFVTGQTSAPASTEGWSGGRIVETGPTTGQMPSSSVLFWDEFMDSLSAGHASELRLVSAEILGCLCRTWWWSVVALVIGQTKPGVSMSKSGWEGGRILLVVPTIGQTRWAVAAMMLWLEGSSTNLMVLRWPC